MNQDNYEELLPRVDEAGNVVGAVSRGECHDGMGRPLHPVVHLHVFDSNGNLYLQKRPMWKQIQPGRWDTAVGGHVAYGESIEEALARETLEELGISDFKPVFLTKYVFENSRERELVYVYKTIYTSNITPSDEVDDGRFWTPEEITAALGKGILTPNFESEFPRIKEIDG